jgi:multicomponent Na+:H+ antiporter subunit E
MVVIKRFAIFFLIWLSLTGADPLGLVLGAVTAGAAAWASLELLPSGSRRVNLLLVLAMAPGFLWRSARGGVDVAWRALHPSMPLAPGWITWRTRLPPGGPRLSLSSMISLLPGTLVVGSRGDAIYLHCLDTSQDVAGDIASEEAHVARAFEPRQNETANG